MAPLYWAPCIVYGVTRYYLPPSISISDQWGQQVEVISPKFTSRAIITEVHDSQPVRLTLDPKEPVTTASNQRAVLDWFYEIRTQFRGRKFALYLFHDRAYQICALESLELKIDRKPLLAREATLSIVSEDLMTSAVESLDFPNGYDIDYPYAHLVGRPKGSADDSGVLPVTVSSYQTPSGVFSGLIEQETPSGSEQVVTVGGAIGSFWYVDAVQITSADNTAATGDSSISAYAEANPAATISSSVTSAQKFGSPSLALGLPVAAGTRIFIKASQGGGHSNVQYTLRLKGA